ncbi:MAG: hypothetical protein ACYCZN_09950 [Candidatus Dormibacteria bacterium]
MSDSKSRLPSSRKPAGGPGFLRRLRDSLDELVNGRQLVPVPIPIGPGSYRPRLAPRAFDQVHLVFGRRRDEAPQDESPSGAGDSPADGGEGAGEEEPPVQLPPIPSAAEDQEDQMEGESAESEAPTSSVESTWSSPADAEPSGSSPFSYDASAEPPDLPAWAPSPLLGGSFPTLDSDTEPVPWGGGPLVPTFEPETVQPEFVADEAGAWPTVESEPVWRSAGEVTDTSFVSSPFSDEETSSPLAETVDQPGEDASPDLVSEELTPAAEAEEFTSFEPESIPEVVAVGESAWSVSTPEPPAAQVLPAASPPTAGIALVEDARAFPLPEGEVLFRNLRSGFTDPARLLRHLAGEGHTGVMHVAATDERNTYIVLVDGYVVAVATDDHGKLTTTNRVSFPNFPNSQDVLNVITYPREIARGLGLLLHAPVHFGGLGAMFVNLDGLSSFLSKHSASGGLVVQSDSGTGVALFDDGKLVGAYSGTEAVNTDLAPLRELIKDLDAEIDVRFGGPKELDPIPLDTLLAGYPL